MTSLKAACCLTALAVSLASPIWAGSSAAARPSAASTSGFKITYALKTRRHGTLWNGGVENASRVRSVQGWHLHDADRLRPPNLWNIQLHSVGGAIAAPGVILDLGGPGSQPVSVFSRRGDIDFVPDQIPYGKVFYPAGFDGNIAVERVPIAQPVSSAAYEDDSPALLRTGSGTYWLAWVAYKTRSRDGFYYEGADEIMVSRSTDGRNWSRPEAITPPGDHFRVALAEDRQGRIWCVYSRQEQIGGGDFNLYTRSLDGDAWSDEIQLTDDPRPDIFHRVAAGRDGNIYLVWMGFRDGPRDGLPQSDILMRRFDGTAWGPEINLTNSPEDDWEPAVAAANAGRAWVAWDSYRETGYDLLLRSVSPAGLGELKEVSATPYAEMRADVVVDAEDRVWISWEEAGPNWGKDTGYENPNHRIHLKKGGSRIYGRPTSGRVRRPRLAVLSGGTLRQPESHPQDAAPDFLDAALFQNPRLGLDGEGRVWVFLRHQWRAAGRWAGHLFDFYATTQSEGQWISPILLNGSTGRQDTVLATAPGAGDDIVAAVVGDGRRLPIGLPKHHDISFLTIDGGLIGGKPDPVPLVAFQPAPATGYQPTHPSEAADLERIRSHRVEVGGRRWKIVRGDLHRHTEISMDGAADGTLWDAYRYALNAASLDFLGVSDHNYGQWLDTDEPELPQSDNEFQWWRTQKSADLFYVPGRFTPLYGYERTPNFPLGHRNIFHDRRGVFSLKVPRLHIRERPELLDQDPQNLWSYLRRTGGIGIPHTPATTMGTDWKRRNDEVIPVTEIYQGDRNSYLTEGGVRAALPDDPGLGDAGRKPYQKGLVQNALGAGYRMGFLASSDHYSTHISYANLIVPDRTTTRTDLLDAFRNRRTYASTDNIVVDFHSAGHHQGSEIRAAESPEFVVEVGGTAPILKVEIVKNNRVIYTREGAGENRVAFQYRDIESFGGNFDDTSVAPTATIQDWSRPETGIRPRPNDKESFYYLRVIQSYSSAEPDKEGEVAWSSPIYVVHD